ncbi:YndM family protein [Halobacillus sp. SY10]|uniref:YndM family protein n=1 Tax=Halobacillus sp. SY10 TaxID=3381356 RepID=UPI00387A0669
MEHLKLFAMKFIFTFAILFILLGAGFNIPFGDVFLISLVLSLVGYAVGDRIVLDRTKNTTATLIDVVLIFGFVYFMTEALTIGDGVLTASFLSALSLATFEYFFHQTVVRTMEENETDNDAFTPAGELRTEASEELTPYEGNDKK